MWDMNLRQRAALSSVVRFMHYSFGCVICITLSFVTPQSMVVHKLSPFMEAVRSFPRHPMPYATFRKKLVSILSEFVRGAKLRSHPLSSVLDCLFGIFSVFIRRSSAT